VCRVRCRPGKLWGPRPAEALLPGPGLYLLFAPAALWIRALKGWHLTFSLGLCIVGLVSPFYLGGTAAIDASDPSAIAALNAVLAGKRAAQLRLKVAGEVLGTGAFVLHLA